MARVLVVDDDPAIRRLVAAKLTACGHEVAEAADGEAAVEGALRDRPEVVLVDSEMPGRSGVEICSTLKAAYQPVVVLVTGHPPSPQVAPGGPDHHLQKPFSPAALAALVDASLAARRAPA